MPRLAKKVEQILDWRMLHRLREKGIKHGRVRFGESTWVIRAQPLKPSTTIIVKAGARRKGG